MKKPKEEQEVLTYEEKVKIFNSKTVRETLNKATKFDELPIVLGFGSSTHHPEKKGGMTTCDFKLWCKFGGSNWFIPNVFRSQCQIKDVINLCSNDNEIVALMELLSAKVVK